MAPRADGGYTPCMAAPPPSPAIQVRRLTSAALAGVERLKRLELPLRRYILPDRFMRVEVETSSRCNRACDYCPVAVRPREDHLLEPELYRHLVDQLAELRFAGRFSPHFFGEPLLDPRLPELLAYTRARLPRASLVVYTNGDALTPKKAQELLDAGVDLFLVTFEAGESKAFADTRRALDRWTLLRRFVVRHFQDDVPEPFNRGGTVLFPGRERHQPACLLPASALVVDAWGKVKLCANDYDGTVEWGDLHHERLMDVWHKPGFVKLRRELLEGRFEKPVCRVCVGLDAPTRPLAVNAP